MPESKSDTLTAAHLIDRWREQLVLILLKGFFFFALLASIIGIPFFLSGFDSVNQDWVFTGAALVIAMLAVLGVAAFAPVPYTVRACGALLMPFMFSIYGLLDLGAGGDTMMMIMIFVTLAFMLFGKRGGMIALVISILMFVGVGWAMVTGHMTKYSTGDYSYELATWVVGGVEVLGFTGVLSLGVITLQDALESAHLTEQEALEEANNERALLEVRVVERTQELHISNRKLKDVYQQLLADQEALLVSEKMASLGRLTAGLAHEMNTPLAAVNASLFELSKLVTEYTRSIGDKDVEILDHQAIAEDMNLATDVSERSISRALSFIRSVKSQTWEYDEEKQQHFDVVQVIEDALLLLNREMMRNRCEVVFEPQAESVKLLGPEASFAQVITNLIANAIDASIPHGGGLITIKLIEDEQSVNLQVIDDGVGIPEDIRTKIFDPLFTTKSFGEGSGLGLSIVHDIVTKGFNGSIDFSSQVGEGTAFSIHFPKRDA